MSTDYDSETHVTRTSIRKVRRIEEPRTPFMPWGLVLPLALLGLSLFSCIGIQEKTEAAAERALTAANLDWANAEASGRYVYLTGDAPSKKAANRAVRVAEESTGKTLIGRKFQPLHVYEKFDVSTAPSEADPSQTSPTPALSTLSPDWSFGLFDGVLKLEGQVPDEATRLRILTVAQNRVSPPRVTSVEDGLTKTGQEAPQGYAEIAIRGINTVTECDRGIASFRSEIFQFTCELPERLEASVRAKAAAPMSFGRMGAITITTTEEVTACEGSLAALLETTQIQFDSDSARINDGSTQLIAAIVREANACPGTLRIEGHTDSTGSPEKNMDLSARRAEAVRAALVNRGVGANRLISRGYGEQVPIADNSTREGRALNRRIQIKVVGPDE